MWNTGFYKESQEIKWGGSFSLHSFKLLPIGFLVSSLFLSCKRKIIDFIPCVSGNLCECCCICLEYSKDIFLYKWAREICGIMIEKVASVEIWEFFSDHTFVRNCFHSLWNSFFLLSNTLCWFTLSTFFSFKAFFIYKELCISCSSSVAQFSWFLLFFFPLKI